MGLLAYIKRGLRAPHTRDDTPQAALAAGTEPARRWTFSDQLAAYNDEMRELYPTFRFEFLELLQWLSIFNHDMSQTVKKIVSLGNVGHSLEMTGSERAARRAIEELNGLARDVFPNHAGADGFINQQFRQIIVQGALCQETIPSMALRGIEQVYQVKTASIRFRFEDNRFVPYQMAGVRKIALNPETFSFIPLITEEDNPYPIPPFVAALRGIVRQEGQWKSIDEFTEKWGILGLVHMVFDLKREMNETPNEFRARAERDLTRYYESFKKNLKDGIAVTGKNVEINHSNISRNIGQMGDIIEANHQVITSGLNIDPAMLGYTYSTTETYALVVYEALLEDIRNVQRIIKRVNEHTYNLHLRLAGIPAVCSMRFNPSPSLKRKEEAETGQIQQQMILERMDKGIIGPDEAARELGYDEAYTKEDDPSRLNKDTGLSRMSFQFNRDRNIYEFIRPRVSLAEKKNDYERIVDLEEGYSSEFFEIYRVSYGRVLSGIESRIGDDDAVERIMELARREMGERLPENARETIERWTGKSYRQGLGRDWSDERWKVTDRNALDFFRRHDQYFFGQQFQQYADDMRALIEDELSGIRGNASEAARRLRENFGKAFESQAFRNYYQLVVRNAVNKSRNYGRVFQYERLGIAEVEIIAILDQKTSRICRAMNGRRIAVKFLADHVRQVLRTPMNELTEKFAWPTASNAAEFEGMSTTDILSQIKVPLPPYHGNCRTTTGIATKVTVKKSDGGTFSGDLRYDEENGAAAARAGTLSRLTREERLSKMQSLIRMSWWNPEEREWPDGTTRTSREYHRAKHGSEFDDFDTAAKNILKHFDRVCTFNADGAASWIVYDTASGAFLQIAESGAIVRFHKFRRFRPAQYMVEME